MLPNVIILDTDKNIKYKNARGKKFVILAKEVYAKKIKSKLNNQFGLKKA